MITYFLKSAACLALLLFFYHLVLEKEKMHTFNRYYLLFGVLLSFLIPFATITITAVPETAVILENEIVAPIITQDFTPIVIEETPIDYTKYLIGLYLLVSAILLFRFGRNLYKIIRKMKINQQVKQANATFVLVDDEILPHTFWNAIFINKTAYFNDEIEKELFTHELTHVTQKHTIDVLLIEVLQIVFWINPLFIFLKKAIQLNHEFLADSTVINTHKNTFQYQHLLVNKAAWNNEYYLASNLNYSLTKKRLKMMTTQSSKSIIWIKKLAVMPLLAGFVFLFAERVEAQEKEEIIEIVEEPISEQKSLTKSEMYKKYVYRNLTIQTKDKNGKYVSKKYSELNDEEKARLMPPPPLKLEKKVPTKAQFEALKDKTKFAVWIDGKVVDNATLSNYKYTDFARYSNSHVYKNARSKRFPQENQANLETTKYFEFQNKKRVQKFQNYLDKEFKVGEIIEEQPKKEYIDSPIIKNNPSSKQSVSDDIRLKLKDVNALKISYLKQGSLKNSKEVTPKEMEIYKTLLASGKKSNIYKQKDILKMQDIYKRMSKAQKQSVENVSELIPPPPPKPDWVYTYKSLASKVKRTSKNRKANLIRLEEIYKKKMTKEEKQKVIAPHLLVPPPPSKIIGKVGYQKVNTDEKFKRKYFKNVDFIQYQKALVYRDTIIGQRILIKKKYGELTKEDKHIFRVGLMVLKPIPKRTPTLKVMKEFQNPKTYAIWIDGVNVPNNTLKQYKPEDFATYSGKMTIHKTGRSKKYPQPFWVMFTTHARYKAKKMGVQKTKYGGNMVVAFKSEEKINKNYKN